MRHRRFLTALATTCAICGCEDSLLSSQESLFSGIEQAIADKDYDTAAKRLKLARKLAKSDSVEIVEYNEAVLEILTHHCESATKRLEALLHIEDKDKHKFEFDMLDTETPDNPSENLFEARVHQALALAIRCAAADKPRSPQTTLDSLIHIYQAYFHGLDTREEISLMLQEAEPPCTDFVTNEQDQMATSINSPINLDDDLQSPHTHTICPQHGLWFKKHIRAHETLSGTIELDALERTLILDDSRSLPYAQFHIDITEPAQGNEMPVVRQTFVQPLPNDFPTADDYKSLSITLPPFTASVSNDYLIHVYPERLGEAQIHMHLSNMADCSKTDDGITYNESLDPVIVPLQSEDSPQEFLLCPTRPDTFELEIAAKQYTLVGMLPADQKLANDLQIQIVRRNGQALPFVTAETGSLPQDSSSYTIIKPNVPKTSSESDALTTFILIYHADSESETYQITFGNEKLKQPLSYKLHRDDSTPCMPDAPEETIPVNLSEIDEKKIIMLPPSWVCSDSTRSYKPTLSKDTTALRVQVSEFFISGIALQPDDVKLQSFMQLPNDERIYLVENGSPMKSSWLNMVWAKSLQKPLTADSLIRVTTSKTTSGFTQLAFTIPEDSQQDKSDKSSQDDKKQQQSQKEDESKGKDNENQSPEKPTETKATPKGPGTDGQGDESTPDENVKGDKAAKFDPAAYERDHIDALLDAIEQGNYYVPLSGEQDEKVSDKDW